MSERLSECTKAVTGLAPITPSTSTPDYVSMENHCRLTIYILCDNATTVTGSAITIKQATDAAASDEKAVAFSRMLANTDTGASDTLVETTVTSDTFTTDSTDAKNLLYVVEIDENDLDLANSFTHVRAGTGNAVSTVVSVLYVLSGERYSSSKAVTAIA